MTIMLSGTLGVPHGFFTRQGGVSQGAYSSLNCGRSGLDDPEHVAENRARAARAIDAHPSGLVGVKQIHGIRAITVISPPVTGLGPEADAMVTDRPGIALGVITADCAPVLFADSTNHIVGAAHAGWRGAVAGVLEATIAAMQGLGATFISAAIGPCIQQASYEVGHDVFLAVTRPNPTHVQFLSQTDSDHWQFDLPGYVAERLNAIGVTTYTVKRDTYAEDDLFFSHRRRTRHAEGAGGHQISIIRCAS
jgi:YfiH family protein